jgi:multiple sugar transport system permease protein
MPKVENTTQVRTLTTLRMIAAIGLCITFLIPVLWMLMTAFKPRQDVIAVPPRPFFQPTLEGFVSLFTQRSTLTKMAQDRLTKDPNLGWADRLMLERGLKIIGPSKYGQRLTNSVIISVFSTILSVGLGVLAAYAFSRFRVKGTADWQFFILSTRMLPPVVVTIPIFLMFRQVGLYDTHIGMILLYTIFNLSLSVWLLKGFIDEIPREYEEAALVDGYSRWQAFTKIVLPQAITGIAATTVFCLIFAWNEYAFALMLTSENARTAPPSIPTVLGRMVRDCGRQFTLPHPGCDCYLCVA